MYDFMYSTQYIDLQYQETCFHLKTRCMDRGFAFLEVAVQGLRTNFWGLGCPSYCGSFPLSSFLAFFLAGWISGVACTIGLCYLLLQHIPLIPAHNTAPVIPVPPRIASYLHERGLLRRQQR